jgi:hypothetical protein
MRRFKSLTTAGHTRGNVRIVKNAWEGDTMKTKKAVVGLLGLPLILCTLTFCSASKLATADLESAPASTEYDGPQSPQAGITFQVVEELSKPEGPLATAYSIGDRGPAGGLVFYDKGAYYDGWRYLEAAPTGTEFGAAWGAYGHIVSGTDWRAGTGKRNTRLIVEYLRQIGETGKATQLCDELTIGNNDQFDDWFLSSLTELDLMYRNLRQKRLGSSIQCVEGTI